MMENLRRAESAVAGPGVALRAGVALPDWSVVSSPAAEAALAAIFDAFGFASRWSGRTREEDRVHRAVLRAWGRQGRAPETGEVAADTGMPPDVVGAMLGRLRERDLVVLDEAGEAIVGAYPFTMRETGHRVRVGGRWLNAMCAIDALGVGAMYGDDTLVESACLSCGVPIRVETRDEGTGLASHSPGSAVVWAGNQYADRCAADSLCTVLAFFCSDGHLESWRDGRNPEENGFRLSLDEGLQVGRAIFQPLLAAAPANA